MNFGPPADENQINALEGDWQQVVNRRLFRPQHSPWISVQNQNPGVYLIERENDASINAVQTIKEGGWSKLRIQMDSGAIDHVMPKDAAPGVSMHPTKASQSGRGYSAANGTKIGNHGEKVLRGVTEEGNQFAMAVQCADVTKTLGSVHRLNQGGNAVIFDGDRSYMIHKATKTITPIKQENGQFIMHLWVKDDVTKKVEYQGKGNRFAALIEENQEEEQSFQRQAVF
jgi:hypothetical protein